MKFATWAMWALLLSFGCRSQYSGNTSENLVQPAAQTRVFYEGHLDGGELAVSVVLQPGWQVRETKAILSVVQANGNVLNISPAFGPFESDYDAEQAAQDWVFAGRKQGSDAWDYRLFRAGSQPGAYAVRIEGRRSYVVSEGRKTYYPGGDIVGELGGKFRVGFSGSFHPGDTDLNEITTILSTLRVETKAPTD